MPVFLSIDLSGMLQNNKNMTAQTIYQEIETLSPKQLESVYSFVCRLKQSQHSPATEHIEPFANEQEAINFVNDYAQRMLNAQG